MVLTGSITGSPLFLPLLAVAGLIIAVILWKILKFTVKKTTSILQGLIAILLKLFSLQ